MGRSSLGAACVLLGVVGFAGWRGWVPVAFRQPAPPAAAAETVAPSPVRLVAVGDLMLGTSVKQTILRRGPEHPFRKYRKLLRGADVAFGNLETPLSDGGAPTPGKSPESLRTRANYIFRAPPAAAEGLAWAGFDVVSVANNHTMDYGASALRDTLDHLRNAGVAPVGAGADLEEAAAPVRFTRNGQRFALFAISDVLPLFSAADAHTPGVAPARGATFNQRMEEAIAAARRDADWVLVSVHWGKERYTDATPRQRRLGRQLIDWGADVVIGHHTHCMGPVERYQGGLIHYSLGNFISHSGSRRDVEAWEVTFKPGERPSESSHVFHWNGDAVARR